MNKVKPECYQSGFEKQIVDIEHNAIYSFINISTI